jgi:hypothetical protein
MTERLGLAEVPARVRLVRADGERGRAPRPPFGLARFDEEAEAIVVVLRVADGWPLRRSATDSGQWRQVHDAGLGDVGEIAAQIPEARSMSAGALVVVLGEADAPRGALARLFGRKPEVARAVRCSALLARGYVRLGGGVDPKSGYDLAWAYA